MLSNDVLNDASNDLTDGLIISVKSVHIASPLWLGRLIVSGIPPEAATVSGIESADEKKKIFS